MKYFFLIFILIPFSLSAACIDNPEHEKWLENNQRIFDKQDVYFNKCILDYAKSESSIPFFQIKDSCKILAEDKYKIKGEEPFRKLENGIPKPVCKKDTKIDFNFKTDCKAQETNEWDSEDSFWKKDSLYRDWLNIPVINKSKSNIKVQFKYRKTNSDMNYIHLGPVIDIPPNQTKILTVLEENIKFEKFSYNFHVTKVVCKIVK